MTTYDTVGLTAPELRRSVSLTVKVGIIANTLRLWGIYGDDPPLGDIQRLSLVGRRWGCSPLPVWFFPRDKYRKIFTVRDSVLSRSMSLRSDNSVSSIRGVGPELADRLSAELDVETIDDLDDCDPGDLVRLDGVGMTTFARLVAGEPERRL